MNETQQLATLAGIPADQIQEFIRQYLELAMMTNKVALWVSGVILALCVWGFIAQVPTRYRPGQDSFAKFCFGVGLICIIVFTSSAWNRYKMTHYPIPYILQDLRGSK